MNSQQSPLSKPKPFSKPKSSKKPKKTQLSPGSLLVIVLSFITLLGLLLILVPSASNNNNNNNNNKNNSKPPSVKLTPDSFKKDATGSNPGSAVVKDENVVGDVEGGGEVKKGKGFFDSPEAEALAQETLTEELRKVLEAELKRQEEQEEQEKQEKLMMKVEKEKEKEKEPGVVVSQGEFLCVASINMQ
jgi:hypothetical protein